MESTTARQPVPLWWKLGFFVPLAVALMLIAMSTRQSGLHRQVELSTIGNLCGTVSIVVQGVYWIVGRKQTALGILFVIVGSVTFGFGLHVLLRAFGI